MRALALVGVLVVVAAAAADDKKTKKDALTANVVDEYLSGRPAASKPEAERKDYDKKNDAVRTRLLRIGEGLVGETLAPAKLEEAAKQAAARLHETVAAIEKVAGKSELATTAAAYAAALEAEPPLIVAANDAAAAHWVVHAKHVGTEKKDRESDLKAARELSNSFDAMMAASKVVRQASEKAREARRAYSDTRRAEKKARGKEKAKEGQDAALDAFEKAAKVMDEMCSAYKLREPIPASLYSEDEVALVKARLPKVRPLVAESFGPEVAALVK